MQVEDEVVVTAPPRHPHACQVLLHILMVNIATGETLQDITSLTNITFITGSQSSSQMFTIIVTITITTYRPASVGLEAPSQAVCGASVRQSNPHT